MARRSHLLPRVLMAACVLVGTLASAQPVGQLEAWTLDAAIGIRVAELDTEIATQRLELARAQQGARLTLGASMSQNQEPLSDTQSRSYGRVGGSAGVRWPLLGSAETGARAVEEASSASSIGPWHQSQVRSNLLRQLRSAYIAYGYSAERLRLAEAFLALESQAAPLLQQRTRAHFLFESDRQSFATMFETARRDRERQRAARSEAMATLRRLTRQPLPALEFVAPAWATSCLRAEPLLAQAHARPGVAVAQLAVEAQQRQLDLMRWSGIDAGVSLSMSRSQDFGGLPGHGAQLGVDLTMPFNVSRLQRSLRTEAQLRLSQAELKLQAARDDDAAEVGRVLDTLAVRDADWRNAQGKLEAALEANRIALLRAGSLDGDMLEQALQARYAVYSASQESSEALQRSALAQIDALAYGDGSECAHTQPVAALPPTLAQTLAQALPTSVGAAQGQAVDEPAAWFVWHGEWLLAADLKTLPLAAQGGRLLVSFNAEQMARLSTDAGLARRLRQNLARLHAQGRKIDLLLGDPTFILPARRSSLLQLVKGMGRFAFDALNLDLERNQLASELQPLWWDYTMATLEQLHRSTSLPLILTTHHREFERPGMAKALRRAGAAGAMAMVYMADPSKTLQVAERLLLAQPGLALAIVQSVEPELASTESTFSAGRDASLAQWRELAARLRRWPNFAGIAVQSLDAFLDIKP